MDLEPVFMVKDTFFKQIWHIRLFTFFCLVYVNRKCDIFVPAVLTTGTKVSLQYTSASHKHRLKLPDNV